MFYTFGHNCTVDFGRTVLELYRPVSMTCSSTMIDSRFDTWQSHDWISEEFEESTVNVEKFFWHKKLHGLADSHFGFTPLNTSGCLFLFCAYFLWSRFAAWTWFHATLAEKILSFLSLATITQRMHSPRLAGIAKIFSTRIMRTSHTVIPLQRSQLCRST